MKPEYEQGHRSATFRPDLITPEVRAKMDANKKRVLAEKPPALESSAERWPCQDLHGGRHPFLTGVDDEGLCNHPECNPVNDERGQNTPHESPKGQTP